MGRVFREDFSEIRYTCVRIFFRHCVVPLRIVYFDSRFLEIEWTVTFISDITGSWYFTRFQKINLFPEALFRQEWLSYASECARSNHWFWQASRLPLVSIANHISGHWGSLRYSWILSIRIKISGTSNLAGTSTQNHTCGDFHHFWDVERSSSKARWSQPL